MNVADTDESSTLEAQISSFEGDILVIKGKILVIEGVGWKAEEGRKGKAG
jgi:hypothetical protein